MGYFLYSEVQNLKTLLGQEGETLTEIITQIQNILTTSARHEETSPQASYDFYDELNGALKTYKKEKLYINRSLGSKIRAFFGLAPIEEKQFSLLRKEIKAKIEEFQKLKKQIWQPSPEDSLKLARAAGQDSLDVIAAYMRPKTNSHSSNLKNITRFKSSMFGSQEKAINKMRLLAHRLMGKKRFKDNSLNGLPRNIAVYKIIRDLVKFQTAYKKQLSPRLNQQLENVILYLGTTLDLLDQKEFALLFNRTRWGFIEERKADITYGIKKTLLLLKPNEKFLLPTGYTVANNGGGHAIAIEFCRQENNQFKMSLYNTGDGAEKLLDSWKIIKLIFDWFAHVHAVHDVSIDEITKSTLIDDLFRPSFEPQASAEVGKNAMMAPFKELQQQQRLVQEEETYLLQTNGTCAHDSIMAWLSLQLDGHLFRCFKHFVINRSIEKLDSFQQQAVNLVGVDVNTIAQLRISGVEQRDKLHDLLKDELKEVIALRQTMNQKYRKPEHRDEEKIIDDDYLKKLEVKVQILKISYQTEAAQDLSATVVSPGYFASKQLNSLWNNFNTKKKKLELAQKIAGAEDKNDALPLIRGITQI
jgi:hypothetical protein